MVTMIFLKGLSGTTDQEQSLNDGQRVFHAQSKYTDLLFRYLIENRPSTSQWSKSYDRGDSDQNSESDARLSREHQNEDRCQLRQSIDEITAQFNISPARINHPLSWRKLHTFVCTATLRFARQEQ